VSGGRAFKDYAENYQSKDAIDAVMHFADDKAELKSK
jgi:hypothetical protein